MEFTGKISGIGIDYNSKKFNLSLAVNENIAAEYEKLKDCEKVQVTIKKYRKKRSLDANAYYWTLINKLSNTLNVSSSFTHNIMLRRYGQLEIIGGKRVHLVLPDTDEGSQKADEADTYHIKPTSEVKTGKDGEAFRTYVMLRGSSTYDTKEMYTLINGIVSECKQVGIETMTPDQLTEMLRLYDQNLRKRNEKNA